MSKIETHCKDCLEKLGETFEYVHKWLDEYFMSAKYKTHHRKLRHHKEGIEEVRKIWGDKAAKAAEIHIKRDLKEDGYDGEIPKNEEEYIGLGLW